MLIDAQHGSVMRRWALSYRLPCERRRQAVTRHGVVFVVGDRAGAIRLLRVDSGGELRIVGLTRVRAPSSGHSCGSAAFAVDPAGDRAIVAGSRGPLAEVNLGSLAVGYHDNATLRRALAQPSLCRACIGRRSAV